MRWTGDMQSQDPGGANEGAIIVLDGGGTKYVTTLNNGINWSSSNSTLIGPADIPLGDFFVLAITGNATRLKRYVNKTAFGSDFGASTISLSGAPIQMMGFSQSAYRPHAQVAAIRIKIEAEYTEQEIFNIVDGWGFGSQPTKFNISLPGDKLGDMIGQGTYEYGGGDISHVLPGQTLGAESVVRFYSYHSCNAQVIAMVRRGLGKIYARHYFYLPSGITWIADGGGTPSPSTSWGFIKIHRTTVARFFSSDGLNGTGIMASIFGICNVAANTMKFDHVSYRPSAGGAETVFNITAIEPNRDAWHYVDLIQDISGGKLTAKYDGSIIADISGITWDQSPVMVTFGQQFCNHIDNPYIHYGKNFSVGEDIPGGGMNQVQQLLWWDK
jgi:hypothetical protein